MCKYFLRVLGYFCVIASTLNASEALPGVCEETPAASPLSAPRSDFDFLRELNSDQFRAVLGLQRLPATDPLSEAVADFRKKYYIIFSSDSQTAYQTDPQANFCWEWGGCSPNSLRISKRVYSPHSVHTVLSNPKHRGNESRVAPLVLSVMVRFLDKREAPDLVISPQSPWAKID